MKLKPYLIATSGIVLDWTTTIIGLSRGFIEAHPQASPLTAFLIFYSLISILSKINIKYAILISMTSFAGFLNNILVLTKTI